MAEDKNLAAVVESKGSLVVKNIPIPEPGQGQVLIKVEACGVCRSDHLSVEGAYPGIKFPRVPGHELVGHVAKLGPGVDVKYMGKRVGVGWHGGYCGTCEACREGDMALCEWNLVTGITHDGGYQKYTVAHVSALAFVPEGPPAAGITAFLCAGLTCFNSLRQQHLKPGAVVAVLGVGGLGHLAVQYANKLGYRVVVISTSSAKKELAKQLGAHHYIDSSESKDLPAELKKLGGASCILATVPDSKLVSAVIPGLKRNGVLLVLGADASPIQVMPTVLLAGKLRIQGWYSGHSKDAEETVDFSLFSGVKIAVEKYPLSKANEAYQRMLTGTPKFRVVIVMDEE